jgi:hypothetical protein
MSFMKTMARKQLRAAGRKSAERGTRTEVVLARGRCSGWLPCLCRAGERPWDGASETHTSGDERDVKQRLTGASR